MLEIFGVSHIGRRRKTNQDAFYVDPHQRFAVVCDGIGGAKGGEKAAHMTIKAMRKQLAESTFHSGKNIRRRLQQGALRANAQLLEEGQRQREYHGMGTTLNALAFCENKLFLCHAGDSRTYIHSRQGFWQLTIDHNVKTAMQRGTFSLGMFSRGVNRKALTQAVGLTSNPQFDIYEVALPSEFTLLSASDGLFDMVSDFDIYETIRTHNSPTDIANRLVSQALLAGGRDNVTVVVSKKKSK